MARHPIKIAWKKFLVYFNPPYRLATTILSGPKPTIVLLHGIGAHSATWNGLMNELRGEYRFVAVDLLGHGASPSPNIIKYTARDHARSVRWTLWRAGIYGRVILVGYSIGAIVAVDFAAHYRRKVKRLVLASLPLYEEPTMSKSRHEVWDKLMRDVHADSYHYLRQKPKLVKGFARLLEKLFGRSPVGFRIDDDNWEPFALSLRNTIEHQHVLENFKHIHGPVDAIYGTRDRVIITGYIDGLAETFRNIRLTTFGGNHEMSAAYTDHLAELLRGITKPKASV